MAYLKDKNRRYTFRLSEGMANFVERTSERQGISPADYLRGLIFNVMNATDIINQASVSEKSGVTNENGKINL